MKSKFNKKSLTEFKKLILKLKEKVTGDIKCISEDTLKKSPKESSGDMSGYAFHLADAATDAYDREFSLELASEERGLLYEIEDALKKTEEGTYGICEKCKLPITKIRLKALPYARLCVKCQTNKEKR